MKNVGLSIVLVVEVFMLAACGSEADGLLKKMTIEEKVDLLVGAERRQGEGLNSIVSKTMGIVPGAAGTTQPIGRLNIPPIVLADGPAGLRIQPIRQGDSTSTYYCTAFPVGTLLSSTWNTELVESVGKAMGNEVHEYGVDVLLGPAINIQRNPLCGRNFEYYSEDPLLTGKIAAAMVRGIQYNGVGTALKHFAANNQETNRGGDDVRISSRALREIYLKGFEIAVREAYPWTIMTSYNKINGVYTSESSELLTDILRNEWGFKGAVMTDWNGGIDNPAQIYAGNDLLMPGTTNQRDSILKAVKSGILSENDVNRDARRVLELVMKAPRSKGYLYSNKPDLKSHALIARESAAEGMVLLKNDGAVLPLIRRSIALFGMTSYNFISGGTGSGDVNEAYTVSLKDGLMNAGFVNDLAVDTLYKEQMKIQNDEFTKTIDSNNPWAKFIHVQYKDFLPSVDILKKVAEEAEVGILTIGRNSGEFRDRKIPNDFDLSDIEKHLISLVCRAFHAVGKKVVVILNIGGVIETSSWKEEPDAILLAWQPGQEGGNSVADVLCGKVNPSGKLPSTFPINYMDIASSANFPYDANYTGKGSFMSVPLTKEEAKNPVRNVDYTCYEEGIYVGYRYFDSFDKEVSYPFGYGLSYTSFSLGKPTVKREGENYLFIIPVTNIGKVPGKEVVQLYVSAPDVSDLTKPAKELKAFAKTHLLQPGETQSLELKVTMYGLASFDEKNSQWKTDAGQYTALFGISSQNILQTLIFTVNKSIMKKVHEVLKPQTKLSFLREKGY
ncbi:MAG: glycoside hydrolase family 3 C-terminal domain-containing protein [Bacteroides sp.]|jgi:beta-glucosidase|nr:glycoside hydrolase family 3 C-terminal domain-containing protein [Bacteroides sp.]